MNKNKRPQSSKGVNHLSADDYTQHKKNVWLCLLMYFCLYWGFYPAQITTSEINYATCDSTRSQCKINKQTGNILHHTLGNLSIIWLLWDRYSFLNSVMIQKELLTQAFNRNLILRGWTLNLSIESNSLWLIHFLFTTVLLISQKNRKLLGIAFPYLSLPRLISFY